MIGDFNFDFDALDHVGQMYLCSDSADKEVAHIVEWILETLHGDDEIRWMEDEIKAVGKALNKGNVEKIKGVKFGDAFNLAQLLSFLNGILYAEYRRTKFTDYDYFRLSRKEVWGSDLWEEGK